jgi:single-strand DNA-binding protein
MFETNICVVGNVLTAPEWRRTSASGRLVTTFKVAAATRRLDRTTGAWVDGNGLRVRVSCWRDLAGGVASSVMVGDPVVVYGQIYTRDWVDTDGTKRTLYEMEAQAVGHNLARGRARFARNKPVSASEVEADPARPVRLGGETTEPALGLPTGLDPSDPLRQLDDSAFDDALRFDEPFRSLAENGNGSDPWRFAGEDPDGGLLAGLGGTDGEAGREGPDGGDPDTEDAEDEESADDAEAVEHRPEEEADEQTGEDGDTPKDAMKARRRRRTPAGV